MYNCLNLLPFSHNCHNKKKKDDFFIFFAKNLLNITDRSVINFKIEKYYEISLIRTIYKTYEDYECHINSE